MPAGRKTFMLSYRTPTGERRKPALGTFGPITVDRARKLAQDFLASVRGRADLSQQLRVARTAPAVRRLSDRFRVEHSEARNKPFIVKGNRITLKIHVLPAFWKIKDADGKRSEIADPVGRLRDRPTVAKHCPRCSERGSIWPSSAATAGPHHSSPACQKIHEVEAHRSHH